MRETLHLVDIDKVPGANIQAYFLASLKIDWDLNR